MGRDRAAVQHGTWWIGPGRGENAKYHATSRVAGRGETLPGWLALCYRLTSLVLSTYEGTDWILLVTGFCLSCRSRFHSSSLDGLKSGTADRLRCGRLAFEF